MCKMQRLCSEGSLDPVDCGADQSIALIPSCELSFSPREVGRAPRPSSSGFTLTSQHPPALVLQSETAVRGAAFEGAEIKRRRSNQPQA